MDAGEQIASPVRAEQFVGQLGGEIEIEARDLVLDSTPPGWFLFSDEEAFLSARYRGIPDAARCLTKIIILVDDSLFLPRRVFIHLRAVGSHVLDDGVAVLGLQPELFSMIRSTVELACPGARAAIPPERCRPGHFHPADRSESSNGATRQAVAGRVSADRPATRRSTLPRRWCLPRRAACRAAVALPTWLHGGLPPGLGADVIVLVNAAAVAEDRPFEQDLSSVLPPPFFHLIALTATCLVSPTPSSTRNLSPLHRISMHDAGIGLAVSAGNGKIVAEIAAVLLDNLDDSVQVRRRHAIFDGRVARHPQGIDVRRAFGRIVEGDLRLHRFSRNGLRVGLRYLQTSLG